MSMRIVYVWRHPQVLSYLLSNQDGHFETLRYLARYYEVHVVAPAADGKVSTWTRDRFTVWSVPAVDGLQRPVIDKVVELQPDAVCCYGPTDEPEWPTLKAALRPGVVFCLDYAGGPLVQMNGTVKPSLELYDHVFTAHETQAAQLRALGVPASKARGVPLERYHPMPIPKLWHIFCPTSFVPGKRPALAAQYCEQYAPEKPSLFLGVFENLPVVWMTMQGNLPCPAGGSRMNIQFGDRAPYAVMPLLYNASEYVICPTQEEAGPWVVMEALACGTPTIMFSDVDWGVSTGFAMQPCAGLKIVAPFSKAIREAIAEFEGNYRQASRAAREYAQKYWDWWDMYETIDKVLKNAVAFRQAGQLPPPSHIPAAELAGAPEIPR